MSNSKQWWVLCAITGLLVGTLGCEFGGYPDDREYENQSGQLAAGTKSNAKNTTVSATSTTSGSAKTSGGITFTVKKVARCQCNPEPNSTDSWTVVDSETNCGKCKTSGQCSLAKCTYINSTGSKVDVGCKFMSGININPLKGPKVTVKKAVGGHYPGPGDTVPPGLKDGFNLQCSQNPLLNFYTSICDSNGLCITNGYLHPYVGQAIISGSKTIPQMLASESSLMKQYSASWSQNGYPKDTCKKLWQPGSWMFVGKGASKVACLTVNWGIGWVSYMDLHADVCSTTTLYDGTP